ncbi:quinone oxidoreductase family protein [Caulobacter sp. KR2-114]|uniref:quinone oxidoreductase family protein n=1 Tax=Caulobacter sp. KR2-114 TaxID=3400912 RepID=UPI003BFD3607
MLAVQAREAGGPEVLDVVDIPEPEPKPGQVVVRHEAVGLNFIDTYQRSGLYPVKFPLVLGQEAAGVVSAVGEGVTRFKAGDRIAYAGTTGAYAEAQAVNAARAVKLPDGISAEVAAAALLKGMTAEFLLRRCYPVKSGQTILTHAAAGGVGTILVQWAKALGATVIGTVGSEEKAALARAHGADHVILYRTEDVPARVKEITGGQGVPVVYDSVGAATFEMSLASLARRGTYVTFGNASGPVPPVPPLRLMQGGSLFMTRPTMGDYQATTEELDESAAALFQVILSGQVKVEIGQRFALKDTRAAHEALQARETVGATVLLP